MVKSTVAAERLKDYMIEHDVTKKEISSATCSSVRTVERWIQYGIPTPKWEMLKLISWNVEG